MNNDNMDKLKHEHGITDEYGEHKDKYQEHHAGHDHSGHNGHDHSGHNGHDHCEHSGHDHSGIVGIITADTVDMPPSSRKLKDFS